MANAFEALHRDAAAVDVPPEELSRLPRERRLRQITAGTMLAFVASMAPDVAARYWSNVAILVGGLGVMSLALVVARRGYLDAATKLLLGSILAIVMVMTWKNAGLYDTGILALPSVLLFAAVLGSGRFFAGMFAMVEVFILVLYFASVQGWHPSVPIPVGSGTLMDFLAIIGVIGTSAWFLASDQRSATRRLAEQNRQVMALQRETEWIATHDALTHLPNRVLARDRFEFAAAEARREVRRIAFLYLDLDHFKNVNDSLGHACGDALLQDVSRRLRDLLRTSDTICRLGGDEFLILVTEIDDQNAVGTIADKVVAELAKPVCLQGMEILTGASIGIAMFPDDGDDFDSLLKTADMAMYRVKEESGRNGYRFYDAEMHATVVEHVQLVSAMRSAMNSGGEFWIAYQPQYSLDSGKLIGAEALLRWNLPARGLVSPAQFIPLAERSGMISAIGDWVMSEACRQAQIWRDRGFPDLVISVNVSPVQFRRGEVEASVERALRLSGLPADRLELELTESLLIDDCAALSETLARLRQRGVRFAIDDFGTGYSNLSYLKRFEVERLKIDQSFIRRLTKDDQDQTIVRAIVQMTQGMGLSTIAEGIEDDETLEALRELGCQQGQGFHWHPGLSANEFEVKALSAARAGWRRRLPTQIIKLARDSVTVKSA